MATCPNKNTEEWKTLVISRGEHIAYYLWDEYDGKVPESESRVEIVKAGLKAVNILLSKQSFDLFEKGKKNNWSLEKILNELQIPKEQKQLIVTNGNTDWNDIISDLIANYSYVVEINTSQEKINKYSEFYNFSYNQDSYLGIPEMDRYEKNGKEISKKEFDKIKELVNNTTLPTQYYSNMTVPGGTNYTENEIATPLITPSIKGHAEFSTDNGIGWFRSDEKSESFYEEDAIDSEFIIERGFRTSNITDGKTRRILEVQSDLFQKGRENLQLVDRSKNKLSDKVEKLIEKYTNAESLTKEEEKIVQDALRQDELQTTNSTANQYLQLLNKDNNWVTFFVKSIIQDSAKKGYEKVLFPTGNTASKVEGHTTLEELKRQKEDRLKLLKSKIRSNGITYTKEGNKFFRENPSFGKEEIAEDKFNEKLEKNQNEIKTIEQELKRVETEGFGALAPIYNFYENTVTNILKKQGYDPKVITDEYGNTWNEVTIDQKRDTSQIYFQKKNLKWPQIEAQKIFYNEVHDKQLSPSDVERISRKLKAISDTIGDYNWSLDLSSKGNYYVSGYKNRNVLIDYFSPGAGGMFLQSDNVQASTASKETLRKVKEIINKMGVNIQVLEDYLKGNPDINAEGVNGLADIIKGIIAISQGKENVALTEETIHVATAILEQTNPKLVTEMISKIDRFAIYDRVLKAYKDDKNYQLPNGKPNIRKIKKEAVDKLIAELIINRSEGSTEFPELLEEAPRTLIQKWWRDILDFFAGMYRKANIDIFEQVAEVIENEDIGDVSQINSEEIFLQKADKLPQAQKDIQQRILDTKDRIQKRESDEVADPILLDTEEASNFYVEIMADGSERRITKRVTDRVKRWYEDRFGKDKKFTEEEKFYNEFKREHGIQYHFYFEDIHARYFNEDGTRKTATVPRTIDLQGADEELYERLEKYFVALVKKFSEGNKKPLVFSEVIVYDPKKGEAGTIDLLIVEETGKANILDWKFMTIGAMADDVPWYKQGAFNIQLGRYKDILKDSYGVKEIGMNRAIPILMDVKRKNPKNPNSELVVKGIEIGSVDVSKIKDLTLVPVSEETETTGNDNLDEAIRQLNAIFNQVQKSTATDEDERQYKKERLNSLKKAIRAAQSAKNLVPLIEVIKVMKREGQNLTNDWDTIYDKRAASDNDITDVQLSEFAEELREYMAIANAFDEINDLISPLIYSSEMEKDAKTQFEKDALKERKKYLDSIKKEFEAIRSSKRKIDKITGKFADKFMGERNLVTGLLSPQAVWSGIGSWFRGASEVPLPSVSILFKLVTNSKSRAVKEASVEVDELLEIRKRIVAKGGDVRKYIQQIYQKDDKDNIVNKIIYKYKKEFFDLIDKNAKEEIPDKNWLIQNIDKEGYQKEAEEVLKRRIDKIKKDHKGDSETINKLTIQEKKMFDVTRKDFTGWNNYILKRHPVKSIGKDGIEESPWLTDEYRNIQQDKDLFDLYNFITRINKKSADVGYIENKINTTFLPFVRKTMAESLAWDFSLSSVMNWGGSLSIKADDIGYGSVNELTGEIEHAIPKYYTQDFSIDRDSEGNIFHDYSDVSEDLFKNMILYINHMHNYKYLSQVEGQLNLIKTIETFKNHLTTNKKGDVILDERGNPKQEKNNEENTKIFNDFLRALLYEQRYPLSDTDTSISTGLVRQMKKTINNIAGKEIFTETENPSATSLFKSIDTINRSFQLKTLGLDVISGAVNLFGANVQVATQAGQYFSKGDYFRNFKDLLGNRFKNDDDREIFIQLVDKFMPMKDSPIYDKLKSAGLSKITRQNFADWLMVFMREPEQHVEKSIFMALLDNMMVTEDGNIISIREFVKNKYSGRSSSSAKFQESKQKIEEEIDELKKTKSINAIKKLQDGKLVIPGLDLDNFSQVQRITNLTRRISRNATGGISDSDVNRMSMSIWTKSMMVFKNWIPKLVDTRFGELRKISDDFSVTINEDGITEGEKYDMGRIRLWWYVMGTSIRDRSSNILNLLQVNEKGVILFDKMYTEYAEAYKKRTGEDFTMSKDDFMDMVRTNLRNQMQELLALLMLVGLKLSMGMMAPDDDKDKATKNFYRFSQRVVDKFVGELSFFYNPLEIERMLNGSAFPAIGMVTDVTKFMSHFTHQVTGFEITDPSLTAEEVRQKAQPIKYLGKMLPVTKSLLIYGAILDSEFAKEYDITIQKQSN